jgi:hypothetical protein
MRGLYGRTGSFQEIPMRGAQKRKAATRPRQAIVIIHGVGEQYPMETLRSFVTSVVGEAHSKPDRISPTLELRRMAVPSKPHEDRFISTDFYELYWAHLMAGTSWRHVIAWARTLMLRWPVRVPFRLLPFWLLSWMLLLCAAWIYWMWQPGVAQSASTAAVVALGVVTLRVFGFYFGLQYVGDAARYLSPMPPNIGVRHAIRSAALDLLRGLHDDPLRRYQRIVVVGHSLGSVIAYDALTHLWQERHHPADHHPLVPAPQPAHDELKDAHALRPPACRDLQSRIWREQRAIGVPWKITDFITLGSPLAHASFLMAKSPNDFSDRKRQRELPTCPPQQEDPRDTEYGKSLLITDNGCKLLHHAALFACTRWTNLYFPGDLIGGPLQQPFGPWVDDHPVQSRRLFGLGQFLPSSHIRYWKTSERSTPNARVTDPNPQTAIEQLGKALDLNEWWTPENKAAALEGT